MLIFLLSHWLLLELFCWLLLLLCLLLMLLRFLRRRELVCMRVLTAHRLKQARKFWNDGVLNVDDFIGCEVGPWGQ